MAELRNLVLNQDDLVQSPFLDLEAQGSNGEDGSVKGVHLRWSLEAELGQNHMPKGNLPSTVGVGFNKVDDFVELYRVERSTKFQTRVDLINDDSLQVDNRQWNYTVTLDRITHTEISNQVEIKFVDSNAYDIASNGKDLFSKIDRMAFLKAYSGVVEARIAGKLCFTCTVRFKLDTGDNAAASELRLESVSLIDNRPDETENEFISYRETKVFSSSLAAVPETIPIVDENVTLQAQNLDQYEWIAPNISYVRFDYKEAYIAEVLLEAYDDYIVGTSGLEETWNTIGEGKYSLDYSGNDEKAFARLDEAVFDTQGTSNWPRFKPTDGNVPEDFSYKLLKDNYVSKWNGPGSNKAGGLREAVQRYILLSNDPTNLRAVQKATDPNELSIPYLDALNFVTFDFHVARMLGLGHVDAQGFLNENESKQYIYLVKYRTNKRIASGYPNATLDNYFMTLPVGALDNMVPDAPELLDFSFDDDPFNRDLDIPFNVIDKEGYDLQCKNRYINLNIADQSNPFLFGSFYFENTPVNYRNISAAIAYGVEYKKSDELNFRNPKIHIDKGFRDFTDNYEVSPITRSGNDNIYTHREQENGEHIYGIYAINLFGRPSELSNTKSITSTFLNKVTLLPPINLQSTIIQKEIPLILSSPRDQKILDDITDSDKTLLRTAFMIDNSHYENHQVINEVELFFRPTTPRSLSGRIQSVIDDPNSRENVLVYTEALPVQSDASVDDLDPDVSSYTLSNLKEAYIGSLFATEVGRFTVVDVNKDSSDKAILTLRKNQRLGSKKLDVDDPDNFAPVAVIELPIVGQYFTAVENMLNVDNWANNELSYKIPIVNFSPVEASIRNTANSFNLASEIKSIYQEDSNTRVFFADTFAATSGVGIINYKKQFAPARIVSANELEFIDDLSDLFEGGDTIEFIKARNTANLGAYQIAVSGVEFINDTNRTRITFTSSIADVTSNYIILTKEFEADILSFDHTNQSVLVKDNITDNVFITNTEVTYTAFDEPVISASGGLVDDVKITALFDIESEEIINAGLSNEEVLRNYKHEGRYAIEFQNKTLLDATSPDFEYQGGVVRMRYQDTYELANLVVEYVHRDLSQGYEVLGAIETPFCLIVRDPRFDETSVTERVILDPGTQASPTEEIVEAAYYPARQFYLTADSGKMESSDLLPAGEDIEKYSLLGARSVDTYCRDFARNNPAYPEDFGSSKISVPASIKAIKIIDPVTPNPPVGATFATRPDAFQKSTYTMDVDFPSTPFSVLFYRANSSSILFTLYKRETIKQIKNDLKELDESFISSVWQTLTKQELDVTGKEFLEYPNSGYRFPLPDNDRYIAPSANPEATPFFPFTTVNELDVSLSLPDSGGTVTVLQMVRQALANAFVPLQERPMLYDEMETGIQTSPGKPVFRGDNGEPLGKGDAGYDPSPMALKIAGEIKVRFTDYSLDGASNEIYFYFAMTMGNQMTFSGRSELLGPILLVNSLPSRPPVLRKVIAQIANPISEIEPAIRFEIDQYLEVDKIKRIRIYRTNDPVKAKSIRTMELVKATEVSGATEDVIYDDFENDITPLFGDPLYYRLTAMRDIKNEFGEIEEIPSESTTAILANLVDVVNPEAPELTDEGNLNSISQVITDVELVWSRTTYNGVYRIFKMTSAGNWSLLDELRDNSDEVRYSVGELSKIDEDGDTIYHRFKVDVENSSGLLNLESKPLTI